MNGREPESTTYDEADPETEGTVESLQPEGGLTPESTAKFTLPLIARSLPAEKENAASDVEERVDPVAEARSEEAVVAVSEEPEEDLSAVETGSMPIPTLSPSPFDQATRALDCLRQRVRAQVLGRDEVIDLVLVALLSDGHVLLEDFPGSGKTTLAKALGNSILDDGEDDGIADFRRVQFTPDLLPSDVTGVSVFDATSGRFHFRRGPIFAHVVLADEINRTSPKVQAAMLEAMAEKQVTVDNVTYALDELFFVIATQNPLDLAGTYPLPAAQLDRFLFKIRMVHIDRQSELDVLNTWRSRRDTERTDLAKVSRSDLLQARRTIDEQVVISEAVKECLVDISRTIRSDERVLQGNSTRSMVLMLPALQALATLRGRDYVGSDDLELLLPRVLGHRIELAPGITDFEDILRECASESLERLQRSTLKRR